MAKDTRTRAWTFLVYPESAPENWRQILDDMHLEWVESPLHEFDTNPTGEVKKAHWHILLTFEGKKSYDQIVEMIAPLNCTIPQKVHNQRSVVRYMAHLDNPDKYQYSINDIVAHGGVDIADLLKPGSSQRYTFLAEMCQFVDENCITEFSQLVSYAIECRSDTWFPLLADNSSYFMGQYIKSARMKNKFKENEDA